MRSDRNGFIVTGNDVPVDHPGVLFLGDSFVESMFIPESVRFVSGVERILNSRGVGVRCLNGGYSGTSTLQLVNVLLNKVVPLVGCGGTVVFFVPQSDVPIFRSEASYWHLSDRYSPVIPPFEPEAAVMPKGQPATESLLRLAVTVAREFGARLILVTSPYRYAPRDEDPYLARMLTVEAYNSMMRRRAALGAAAVNVAAETGVDFIDAMAAFMDHPEAFYDELHLNDEGQAVFAEWLAGRLTPMLQDVGPLASTVVTGA
ncbi:SGNH/GDSL hydrolase family protein [Arthrobacter oryzae]|uniref:SGNH/GDSL hydrolase family protein n=1 Tax=Arthrobacter oryzae TaxID=409290 RepID=A0A3N0BME7_9MICC|nr:SGNH/GDSL hydrolase family protein [Arthrobacter oryzae]